MLRIVSERRDTDSTTPCTCNASMATVSPIWNQCSKNMSRPAITSVRNRCAANAITIARNDAPTSVCTRCAPESATIASTNASGERDVAHRRLDQ